METLFMNPTFVVAVVAGAIGYGMLKGQVSSARSDAARANERLDKFEQGAFAELRASVGEVQQALARIEGRLSRQGHERTRASDAGETD